ncbi:NAD-dependent epimerase/dehydratase family protein [Heyndrickxia oleronia]|uniref:NAD-dependent dehydratase n=1 Tax=Heyndrickxia oleronia TaxID=38875 RepID=A0A8E2I9D8_9BACI|nr:NAD-dependent epimerase/dehydratase family protein [Heyndrickxia oleronia]MEC1374216.1 NAD-dependent epimerase/dehydratase family protein [Heyndrickxia oleronia]OOP66695.1 NAD-dependent dehydratase [Heyndrickxia oleronia]QQZ07185.1 NAD-dependent epimerase/dehydratase family protein [Heyndrickxia oleronia]
MKTALVLGGTRFFGVKLVHSLIRQGVEVTVATRGKTNIPFSDKVKLITFDRNSLDSFQTAFEGGQWDVVYDQICYSGVDARNAVEIFQDKTKKYIFTSTLSVYDLLDKELVERDFDPYTYPIDLKEKDEVSYQEGKRQAEAVFFQKASLPVTAVRFPIVLGGNDYTERMTFYINKVINDEAIYLRNLDASISFVNEDEAGDFLAWIGQTNFDGPINCCTNGSVTLREFISFIELAAGKKAKVEITQSDNKQTPYSIPKSWTMSNQKARDLGYHFQDIHQWLPELIKKSI